MNFNFTPWWKRHDNTATSSAHNEAHQPTNEPTNQTTAEEDAVLLPPGASTDDLPAENLTVTASNAGNKKEGTETVLVTENNVAPAAAAPVTPTAPAPAAATPEPAIQAEQHPVLVAALAAEIDTPAKFAAMQAEAIEGRAALTAARTAANAAAVAFYGTDKPEKVSAAEAMVAGQNSVAQLEMLTENWYAGAPGAGLPRNEDGTAKRQTNSQVPENAAKDGDVKPRSGARNKSGAVDPYAQFNTPRGAASK